MTEVSDTLQNLRAKFKPEEVKQRQGPGGKALDYVPIETVLSRLLDTAPEYSWDASVVHIERREFIQDGETRVRYDVVVSGSLTVGYKSAAGFGSMTHQDLDMAVKSANSEAMKNAAKNGFGVGLELWDAEYRGELATGRLLAAGDPAALKVAVFEKFVAESGATGTPTADDVADHFNVTVKDLKDPAQLKAILGL